MRMVEEEDTLKSWLAGRLKERIEGVLAALVTEPLQDMGRAADMAWLGFGSLVDVPDLRLGGSRRMPQHAIHIQCPFRLSDMSGPIATASDMYYPPLDPNGDEPEGFDWDIQGGNWYDVRVAGFLGRHRGALKVEKVQADAFGGFDLLLSEGHRLEVFPSTSFPKEHWRYLRPGDTNSHFVVVEAPEHGAGG